MHAQLVRQWLEKTTDQMQAVEPRERYWESTLRYVLGTGAQWAGAIVCRDVRRYAIELNTTIFVVLHFHLAPL